MNARLLLIAALLWGCGSDGGTDAATTSGGQDAGTTADAGTSADAGTGGGTDTGVSADAGKPAKPEPPKPYAYSGGDCPKLKAGHNAMFSWDKTRTFDIYLPKKLDNPGLLFMWHGLGDNKANFGQGMGAQFHADTLGAIAVVPQSKGAATGWGWAGDTSAAPDAQLFDDLLTCIDAQYDIDNRRVYTTGFSAGALWSSYLVVKRSTFLAAAVIWSGGTGSTAYPYKTPKRKIPVLASWGGKNDTALIQFEQTTGDMVGKLIKDGHYVIACNHGLGHTIPQGGLQWGLKFLAAHDWDSQADSPLKKGDTSAFPDYCVFSQ